MSEETKKNCISCKYMEQKFKYGTCGHPDQKNQELKEYTYHPFSCELHEKGISDSRIQYMQEEAEKQYEATQLFLQAARLYSETKLFATPK